MQPKITNHTDKLIEDIRNIYLENPHSMVLMTASLCEALIKQEGLRRGRRDLDCSQNYAKEKVTDWEKFERTKNGVSVTDTLGIVSLSKSVVMIVYFHSDFVKIERTDDNGKRHRSMETTSDETEVIVFFK